MKNRIYSLAALLIISGCRDITNNSITSKRPVKIISVNNHQIVGIAEIQPKEKIISLFAQTGGVITKIDHDINDEIREGEVILEQNDQVEQAQLKQAQSKLTTQQAIISSTRAQLASLQIKSENALVNYNRNQKLLASGAITQQTLDDSRFVYESSVKDAEAAKASEKQQESKLGELRADLNYNETLLAQKKIRAPCNGKVLSVDVNDGNYITTSQSIGDLAPDGPLMAITEVDELYAEKVQAGMNAYIRPQGKTDTIATGKIFLTSPYLHKKSLFADNASNMEDRRVREVRVLLEKNARVLIGSRVECVIELNQ